MKDAAGDDLPFPPPPSVAARIPKWEACGEQSCGRHEQHYSSTFYVPDLVQGDAPAAEHDESPCDECEDEPGMSNLHVLNCGHKLCRSCLNDKARSCHEKMVRNKDQIDHLLKVAEFVAQGATDLHNSPEYAAETLNSEMIWRHQAYELTGFVCCGKVSGLQKFIPCMEPDVAKNVWTDVFRLVTPVDRRLLCGWPDCQAFVPWVCFSDHGGRGIRWHCVKCGGNSQPSDSKGKGAISGCPAR